MRWIVAAAGLTVLCSGKAYAHAVERGLVLLLPTELYLTGGAAAVAVSFLALVLLPRGVSRRVFGKGMRLPPLRMPGRLWIQTASFAGWAVLVTTGFLGARDPLSNPLPLVIWTLWWIGLVGLVAGLGNLWRWVNPWSAPMAVLRRLTGPPSVRLPKWASYWPATLGFGLVVWFEIVDLAPEDPARLARAALGFWAVQLAGMMLFGEAQWVRRGEPFSVLFRLVAQLSPLQRRRLRVPGSPLVLAPRLPLGGWLFVLAVIAGVTFDGLSGTFWWMGQLGINPLEFPGRSAVVMSNTLGLIGTWAALALGFTVTVAAGRWAAGSDIPLATCLGRAAPALLPIALGYHLSHYLTYLMVNGQYAMIALADPLGTGNPMWGRGRAVVTTSFLNNLDDVRVIWQVQVSLIVGGHVLAVLLADATAEDLYRGRRAAMLSQIPMGLAMVGLTLLGLWLLSTPTAV